MISASSGESSGKSVTEQDEEKLSQLCVLICDALLT